MQKNHVYENRDFQLKVQKISNHHESPTLLCKKTMSAINMFYFTINIKYSAPPLFLTTHQKHNFHWLKSLWHALQCGRSWLACQISLCSFFLWGKRETDNNGAILEYSTSASSPPKRFAKCLGVEAASSKSTVRRLAFTDALFFRANLGNTFEIFIAPV